MTRLTPLFLLVGLFCLSLNAQADFQWSTEQPFGGSIIQTYTFTVSDWDGSDAPNIDSSLPNGSYNSAYGGNSSFRRMYFDLNDFLSGTNLGDVNYFSYTLTTTSEDLVSLISTRYPLKENSTSTSGWLVNQDGNGDYLSIFSKKTDGSYGDLQFLLDLDPFGHIGDSIKVKFDFGTIPSQAPPVAPEPATLLILGIGVAGTGIAALRRRKN